MPNGLKKFDAYEKGELKETIEKEFDLIEIWNAWINFCKQQIAYDLARAFFFSLITYSISGLGGHYIFKINALSSHYAGLMSAFLTFGLITLYYGKKNDWIKNLDDEMEL